MYSTHGTAVLRYFYVRVGTWCGQASVGRTWSGRNTRRGARHDDDHNLHSWSVERE